MSLFKQPLLDIHEELIIDLFCGGGGASSAIEQATGRMVDIAINHDAAAVAMHQANHPQTLHLVSDVFEVDPKVVTDGRPVGFLWASPDCTFHSKARGGKPIREKSKKRRALAWVVTRWACQVRPRVIMLENVEEFANWGPLIGPPDALKPCPRRRGLTFRKWVRSLVAEGYAVEWRELRACDYGAPTIRKRLFLIARCDGQAIVWPDATHGDPKTEAVKGGRLLPWRTAAECIDWTIPMCSIFATKEEARAWGKAHGQASPIRPLADNTLRRVARGIGRFVLENPHPYLINVANSKTTGRGPNAWTADEPLRTVTSSNGFGVVAPHLSTNRNSWKPFTEVDEPTHTIVADGAHLNVVAPMISPITHQGDRKANDIEEPVPTITCAHRGEMSLVAPSITTFRSGATGTSMDSPLSTVTANSFEKRPGGSAPIGIMAPVLVPRYGEREGQAPRARSAEEPSPVVVPTGNGAALVAANMSTFYGAKSETDARGAELKEPLKTQGTENRHALVASFLNRHSAGFYTGDGRSLDQPNATVCAEGTLQAVVGASLTKLRGTSTDADPQEPLDTISAGGTHHGLVAATIATNTSGHKGSCPDDPLSTIATGGHHGLCAAHIQRDFGQSKGSKADDPLGTVTADGGGHAALVASFMAEYYSKSIGQDLREPQHTIPTVDRFGLVTVEVTRKRTIPTSWGAMVVLEAGTYVIDDICMRMLQPKELYAAQGFRTGYIIDRGADGRLLTKTEQVRMVGNSVSPPPAEALVRANCPELIVRSAQGKRRGAA